MLRSALFLLCAILFAGGVRAQSPALRGAIAATAKAVVASFDAGQRAKCLRPFGDSDRLRWSNEPVNMHPRQGIELRELSAAQKTLVHRLLQTVLSEQGYLKAVNIIRLDDWLKDNHYQGDVRQYYGSGRYWLTIFGTPGDAPWAWRFEGHHFSLSVTLSDGGISVTPFFVGSHPAVLPDGPEAGMENMFAETGLARKLMASLSPAQRNRAVTSAEQPRGSDILTRTGREAFLHAHDGLPAASLNPDQQATLLALIDAYVNNLTPELARRYRERIQERDWPSLRLVWMGPTAPDRPIYYRLQSDQGLVIEYCSRQQDTQHIHSVWRIIPDDFGKAL